MNYLFCSVGRRGELLKNFRESMDSNSRIIATDNSKYAPALFFADKYYIVPKINSENYIKTILDICKKEEINAITTFIDPEIEILANNREVFEELGIAVLAPYKETAELCFDKYKMYKFLTNKGILTTKTWEDIKEFDEDYTKSNIDFPVFVKPRNGSGSVGVAKIATYKELKNIIEKNPELIIQEYMTGEDLDADVYVDTISHEAVSIFSKKKIETRIGGANKTISFKDDKLVKQIQAIVSNLEFSGPIDMDFFYKDGKYYLSEINPRFGGAYLHAYGAGVDFIKLIDNNLKGNENEKRFHNYEEDVVMMMYDSVVICDREGNSIRK